MSSSASFILPLSAMCPPPTVTPSATFPGLSPCYQTGNPVGRKMIPEGSRGVGGRLCPWSRCLTFAKPAKHLSPTPVRGEVRGVGQERGVRRGGQTTAGWGRSTGATCPQKTNHRLHVFTPNIICLSVLPFSSVAVLPFSVFSQHASVNTLYIPSHTSPSTPHSICPFGLPLFLIIKPLRPPAPSHLVGKVNAVLYVEGFECNLRS